MKALRGSLRVGLWGIGLLVFLVLAGCRPNNETALSPEEAARQTATAQFTPAVSSITPGAERTPSPITGQSVIRVWLPPQFHVSRDTAASRLLQARIDAFAEARPGLLVDVRAKAETGEGGMLNTLGAANSAAPAALPDLILLPRPLLESAALKGYLRSMDNLGGVMQEQDWFDYARDLGRVQNSVFGIPFASDLLVLVYAEQASGTLPQTWSETITITHTLGFSAGDPQALFTIALYQSAGGKLRDEQGLPMLDEQILARILEFYAQGNRSGQIPFWLMQYTSDSQVLDLFRTRQVDLLAAWRSVLERSLGFPTVSNFTSLPTEDGKFYSLASGYVWVLAGTSSEGQSQALELVRFLSDPSLQAEWNLLSGYLPPRRLALDSWPEEAGRQTILDLSLAAQPAPPTDLLEIVGPLLKQAVQQVLLQQAEPQAAAKLAAESLKRP